MIPLLTGGLALLVAESGLKWLPRVVTVHRSSYWGWIMPLALVLGVGAGLVGRVPDEAGFLALFAGVCSLLVVVDIAEHRIPDSVLLLGSFVWGVGLLVQAGLAGDWVAAGRSVLAGVASLVAFFILAILARGSLGLGDVKFTALLGAVLGWFGWWFFVTGFLFGLLLHGAAALAVLLARRDMKAEVPMGPALVAGASLALVVGLL